MRIAVLIAGVHDPKWPIRPEGDQLPKPDADLRIMSPFDEAALEMALRIRDADAATTIHVHVAGGSAGGKIARAVAAFNPTDIATVEIDNGWDQAAISSILVQVCGRTDLVLIGREFGDLDDGLVPAMLAARLGADFFARAQVVEAKDGLRLMREADGFEERCSVSGRLVVSVTNDRRTRLRKPLMKNVMLARQAMIGSTEIAPCPASGLKLLRATEHSSGRSATRCTMIEGASEQQAQTLASLLLGADVQ